MTVNVGRVSGGTSINTIAAEAAIELDLRADRAEVLEDGTQRAVAQLQDAPAGLEATVEQIGHRPSGCLPSDHPLLAAACRARDVADLPAAEEGWSSTDANAAYARGIPAITVGVSTGGNTHRVDEYIDTQPVEQGLRAIEALAAELVLPGGA